MWLCTSLQVLRSLIQLPDCTSAHTGAEMQQLSSKAVFVGPPANRHKPWQCLLLKLFCLWVEEAIRSYQQSQSVGSISKTGFIWKMAVKTLYVWLNLLNNGSMQILFVLPLLCSNTPLFPTPTLVSPKFPRVSMLNQQFTNTSTSVRFEV